MSKFPLPTDERLESLIRASFEYMPGPDMRRLEQLENRLARTGAVPSGRPVNTLPWWIVLLLAGGFATAAWWAGEKWLGISEPLPVSGPAELSIDNGASGNGPDTLGTKSESEDDATGLQADSPVIYQRENFQ